VPAKHGEFNRGKIHLALKIALAQSLYMQHAQALCMFIWTVIPAHVDHS